MSFPRCSRCNALILNTDDSASPPFICMSCNERKKTSGLPVNESIMSPLPPKEEETITAPDFDVPNFGRRAWFVIRPGETDPVTRRLNRLFFGTWRVCILGFTFLGFILAIELSDGWQVVYGLFGGVCLGWVFGLVALLVIGPFVPQGEPIETVEEVFAERLQETHRNKLASDLNETRDSAPTVSESTPESVDSIRASVDTAVRDDSSEKGSIYN